jgi:hypothetical protein
MQNVIESLTFLAMARETLAETVNEENSKSFLINEATDFEILHLLVSGKFPKARQSLKGEQTIMDSLKTYVLENKETFETFIGPTAVSSFVSEVDIISPLKISSSLKFIKENLVKDKKSISEADIQNLTKLLKKGKDTVSKKIESVKNLTKKQKLTLGAGALAVAALAGYAAYKIYQNYFSKVARHCSGSPDKVACVKKARVAALKAQATTLKSSIVACGKTSNPDKCRASVNKKISGVEEKISKLIK